VLRFDTGVYWKFVRIRKTKGLLANRAVYISRIFCRDYKISWKLIAAEKFSWGATTNFDFVGRRSCRVLVGASLVSNTANPWSGECPSAN
jgi:hypothetical protein